MSLDGAWAVRWMKASQKVIAANRERLIDLDRQIGDGDHGENMDRGFSQVVFALDVAEPASVQDVLKIVAKTLMSTVGGAAGPLFGTAFMRAAKEAGEEPLDSARLAAVVGAALGGIQARGKAERGEKTMVDVWGPACDAAEEAARNGAEPLQSLEAIVKAANEGVQATEAMKATKGRASYLGERSIGHIDPGAASSALILEQALVAAQEV